MEYIIVDIDGTIADTQHLADAIENNDWSTFNAGVSRAVSIDHTVLAVQSMLKETGARVVFITAREEAARAGTEEWLFFLFGTDYELHMRPDGNYASAADLKESIILEHGYAQDNVIAVFEDDPDVVQMYLSHGLPVLQVPR